MMSEQNKKLVRELVENVYGGELKRLDEFVSTTSSQSRAG